MKTGESESSFRLFAETIVDDEEPWKRGLVLWYLSQGTGGGAVQMFRSSASEWGLDCGADRCVWDIGDSESRRTCRGNRSCAAQQELGWTRWSLPVLGCL